MIMYVLLAILIAAAFYTDVTKTRIPNVLTVGGCLVGLLYNSIVGGWTGFIFAVIGMLLGFIVLLLLYLFGALAAGDVKLFAAIGAITGTEFALQSIMYSIIYAGIMGLLLLVFKKQFLDFIGRIIRYMWGILMLRNRNVLKQMKTESQLRFPFMYAVVPGIVTAYIYTH